MEKSSWLQDLCVLPDDQPRPSGHRPRRGPGQSWQTHEASGRQADPVRQPNGTAKRVAVGGTVQIEPHSGRCLPAGLLPVRGVEPASGWHGR